MKITVKLGAPLSQIVGEAKVSLSLPVGTTAADVLNVLRARYPDFEAGLQGKGLQGAMREVPYTLFLNARLVSFEDVGRAVLRDGDRIYLFLPIAGG